MLRIALALVALASADIPLENKKVGVKEVVVESPVAEVHWCGEDHKEVLMRTRVGKLYRSDDFGENWHDVTDELTEKGSSDTHPAITSIVGNPNDSNVVLAITAKRVHFVSEDAGVTWRPIKHTGSIHSFIWHPTNPRFALLSTWTLGCDEFSHSSGACRHLLYVTKDSGRTFAEVATYVVQFSWGSRAHKQDDRIYFTHYRYTSGDQPRLTMWTPGVDFSFSDDFGSTRKQVVDQGNKFLVSGNYIFVAKLKDPAQQTVTLEVSSDGAKSFRTARLPISLDEKSYTVLDTSEGGVILHVNHGTVGGGQLVGNVYVSDAAGIRFALSLPGNLRSDSGECEFSKVLSMEGVYLANMWDQTNAATLPVSDMEENAYGEAVDAYRTKHGKEESYVKTVLSMDKGGKWYYLTPPKTDSLGKPIECGKDCSLHLHGLLNSRIYAPFYSTESAVGLILGTGNVGPYLRYEREEVNTYLSRDGGLTWLEIHKGAFIYEFGDHGGLVVMADDLSRTKQVVFSWNEGKSWFDFDVGSLGFEVDNIITEPNAVSTKFVLYGTRAEAGVLYHLDFSSLQQPPCKGIWAADSFSSDYETWTPTDGSRTGERCLLGKQVTYTRRKQESECFNGELIEKPVHKKTCECAMDDYMCELGFARGVGESECKPSDLDNVYLPEEIQCTSSGWFMADAYRKVLGNVCVGGFQPGKVQVPCPPTSPFSRGAVLVLVLVVLVVGALALLTYAGDNERVRKFLEKFGVNVESVRSVRYSTLTKGWGQVGEVDEFDRDAPTLVTVEHHGKSSADLIQLESTGFSGGVRMRTGGLAGATETVPKLHMPGKELDEI